MIEAIEKIGEANKNKLDSSNFKEDFLRKLSNKIKTHYYKIEGKNNEKKLISIKKIILNLKLNNSEIEVLCDQDLSENEKFVFSPATSNGKKIDFNANNLKYHLNNTIPDLIRYLEEDYPNSKCGLEFLEALKRYSENFYQIVEKKDKASNVKKNKKGIIEKTYSLDFSLVRDKMNCNGFEELIIKKLNISEKEFKNNYQVFFLYIDDKNIFDTSFKKYFVDLKFYDLVERFFYSKGKGKGIKEEKKFHLGNNKDLITNEVSILTKFYMTDKITFFENFKDKNAYKSFSVNQKSYEELLLGVNEIWKNFNFSLNWLNYLLIPKSLSFIRDLEKNTKIIKETLSEIENSKKEFESLKNLSEVEDWKFDMLFYKKEKSAFNVFKIINDLSYFNLNEISKILKEINQDKDISKILRYQNYSFSLNQFWSSLYLWINLVKFKDKKVLYRVEFLDYLDAIYNRRKINQESLVKKILFNLKKNYYDKKDLDKLNPLILNSFNSIIFLLKLKLFNHKKMNENKNLLSGEISNEGIRDFFNIHSEIFGGSFENGIEKQGLVLLGYLVNQVIFSQGDKSKNFINKINFDGIKKEKVSLFINEVIEFLNIYTKSDKPLIKWNSRVILEMQERLMNINESNLAKEEITYYILLGNFLGKYLGIKKGIQKENESETNKNLEELESEEEENDDTE